MPAMPSSRNTMTKISERRKCSRQRAANTSATRCGCGAITRTMRSSRATATVVDERRKGGSQRAANTSATRCGCGAATRASDAFVAKHTTTMLNGRRRATARASPSSVQHPVAVTQLLVPAMQSSRNTTTTIDGRRKDSRHRAANTSATRCGRDAITRTSDIFTAKHNDYAI